ncbi:MAG: hypothetical protein COV08_02585 [Candidatus Vogelbacteria bacterium CG10_big_fil_rev_8_21_14_0_10_49_38]|uniref:Uncharacterized protein n=1 Tax=Candidatus Vogelbacteria bacterium CG10_big_fil_rev_8_21_14_0_10_49_38 TaxID=1975043 RepID=A0A2H0RHJ1_9BACT|nr:MAG: hypothetical protein BK006_02600 [bacterium CG10_49_38]PIR45896.1 MAG: hypothetical protein COV08_02585 [Candidatus Vogelbacteria bacterium CG10_big_fil_rev_8_21_14_0_10_49_38]
MDFVLNHAIILMAGFLTLVSAAAIFFSWLLANCLSRPPALLEEIEKHRRELAATQALLSQDRKTDPKTD